MHEPSFNERRRNELRRRIDRLCLELITLRTGLFAAIEDLASYDNAAAYASQLSVAADELAGVLHELALLPPATTFRVVE